MTSVETVWVNGRVRTMDPARPWAQAMLVRGGRIVHVGNDADILAAASPGAAGVTSSRTRTAGPYRPPLASAR